jgi:hypothetical protein
MSCRRKLPTNREYVGCNHEESVPAKISSDGIIVSQARDMQWQTKIAEDMWWSA